MDKDVIRITGVDTNKISDGFHTFGELYAHRIELFLALCRLFDRRNDVEVWKSKLHSDGSVYEGWFIVGIGYKPGTQITYHLPDDRWNDADFTVWSRAPKYDGHSSDDVIKRLKQI